MTTLRSQRLASKAHARVEARAMAASDRYVTPKYASRVKNVPVWIRENGLIQTLMFLQDKANGDSGETDRQLLEDIAAVLDCAPAGVLIQKAENNSSIAYRLLTRNALNASMWMKRWCSTFEKPKPSPNTNTIVPAQNEAQ